MSTFAGRKENSSFFINSVAIYSVRHHNLKVVSSNLAAATSFTELENKSEFAGVGRRPASRPSLTIEAKAQTA